jgi:tol-pal system protein YbgF
MEVAAPSQTRQRPVAFGHRLRQLCRGPELLRVPELRQVRILVAALVLAFAGPVAAALFDDDEARKRIEATNQRLTQVQRQLEDRIAALEAQMKSQGLVDLFNQVEQIKADVARLRGQIEVLNHELEQAGKRQRDLYVDLDSRLRKIESAPAPTAPAASGTPGPAGAIGAGPGAGSGTGPGASSGVSSGAGPGAGPGPGTASAAAAQAASPAGTSASSAPSSSGPATDAAAEQRAYDAALDQFKNGNYAAAITGFTAFVRNYPRSPLAPSAQYWIGNAQYAQKDYRGAIASQRQLLAAYPDNPKAPDAMLNIASSQLELGDAAGSRRTLEDLVKKYPKSEAAGRARQRLAGR